MLDELGIELIFANSPEAKGKIERANRTLQGRLLVDIQRHNIKTYEELNIFFNDKYCKYLNHKFSYKPKDEESSFVKIEKNMDINSYMCIRTKRKFLDGNVISYKNGYYKMYDENAEIIHLYRGTEVEVRENIFDGIITIKYGKKIYGTTLIEKKNKKDRVQNVVNDQKDLVNLLNKKE